MDNITNPKVNDYIIDTLKDNQGILKEIEDYGYENDVPIIKKDIASLIEVLIKMNKPKQIIEVGTAIGYSSILMCLASNKEAKIKTFERNPNMAKIAKENIKRAGLSDHIEVIEGDAIENLKMIDTEFDLLFLDAAKSKYMEFYELTEPYLKKGGLILSDNILHKGMVASDDYVIRRQKTIVKYMRKYLDFLCQNDGLQTSLLPVSDGFAISYKL